MKRGLTSYRHLLSVLSACLMLAVVLIGCSDRSSPTEEDKESESPTSVAFPATEDTSSSIPKRSSSMAVGDKEMT